MKKIFLALIFLTIASCSGTGKKDSNVNTLGGYLAFCQVSNGVFTIVCLDFPNLANTNQTSCLTNEEQAYVSFGANNAQYLAVSSANTSTSCGLENPTLTLIGSCSLSDRIIRYYSNTWTVANAQTNCTSRAGNFYGIL